MSDEKLPPGKPIEFCTYESTGDLPGADAEFEALAARLNGADDCGRYREGAGGAAFVPADVTGYTVLEVLPILTGRPFNNLALAYLHGLRPSAVRVSRGTVPCDCHTWRVTVFLDDKDLITKVEQEVAVGYGSGAEVASVWRAALVGATPRKPGNAFGHTAALLRADF